MDPLPAAERFVDRELTSGGRAMIRIVLEVAAGATVSFYLLGVAWAAYRAMRIAPAWLREHPRALGGPLRRALTIAGRVLAWPLALLALGWVLWRARHRCPFGECAMIGWRTPGMATRAPIAVYRCPHHPPQQPARGGLPREAAPKGREERGVRDGDGSLAPSWYATFLGMLAAAGVGALAAIPIPGPGYLVVDAVVACASVEPLEAIFRELLARGAARSNRR